MCVCVVSEIGLFQLCKITICFSYNANNDIIVISNHVQPLNFAYVRLLNKPYENEVTLTGQNPPLKCCQPLELLTHFERGLDFIILKIFGL